MTDSQRITLKALETAKVFGLKNVSAFPIRPGKTVSNFQTQLDKVTGLVALMKQSHTQQTGGGVAADTTTKGGRRVLLKRKVRRLAEAIIPLAKERKTPAMRKRFLIGSLNVDANLVARANAFADAIEEYDLADTLADLSFSETLADDLRKEAEEFSDSDDAKAGSLQEQVGSTVSLDKAEQEGRLLLANMNTAVQNRFEHSPEILAAWATASRLEQPGNGADDEEDDETPEATTPEGA